ncbi:MAG: AAA family ATPase, partial [Cyanobacteria bacterium P01_F01_bin.33]
MKTILLGNAGAGKSTLARKLIEKEPAVRLSLDEIAFAEGATRRPLAESIADANDFIAAHRSWIIEGCY